MDFGHRSVGPIERVSRPTKPVQPCKTEPGNLKGGDGVFQLPLARFIDMFPNVFMSA